ncbi:MAG: transglutaminase-like domain-containing protein [Clostridiales Family XIII bacterium]|jgi:transglutaminase-like putative cysteine protease|nr:transglutaminase-like domain-containing protein [Clostridiales Family XIII bacterium]
MRFSFCGKQFVFIAAILFVLIFASCERIAVGMDDIKHAIEGNRSAVNKNPDAPDRDNSPKVLVCEAPGEATFGENGGIVDFSNADDGYVMVRYEGNDSKVKVQITFSDGEPYTYDLKPNADFTAFPLSLGSGDYDVGVFTNIEGNKYAQATKRTITAEISDEFSPFLRPNQYVYYTPDSEAVAMARDICEGVKSELGATENLFLYVVENVSYDYEKAETVQSGYLPNVDETLRSGAGICFDYASLTSAMLRSQGIPCKLVIGYAGSAYHSWIRVYSRETGEVAGVIEFRAGEWSRMDPTFTAGGSKADPNTIGDGTNYNPIYEY